MAFTINSDIQAIAKTLSFPGILINGSDAIIALSAANSVLRSIYNNSTHIFTFLKKQTSISTVADTNNVDISTITDFDKIIDVYYDKISDENRIYQTSPNYLNNADNTDESGFYVSQLTDSQQSRPRHYTAEYLPGKLFFDGNFVSAETLIIIYKIKLVELTSYTTNVPLPDEFRQIFYEGMIEYLIQPTNNLKNFDLNYWRTIKQQKINDIIDRELSAPTKKRGMNINQQLRNLSYNSKNPN